MYSNFLNIRAILLACIFTSNLFAISNTIEETSLLPDTKLKVLLSHSFSLKKYVALKKLNAFGVDVRIKPTNFYGLYLEYEKDDISFKGFILKNKKTTIRNKFNIGNYFGFNFTTDLIYTSNKAENLGITHEWTLNKILKTTFSKYNIKIKNNVILLGNIKLNIYDKNGNFIQPKANISDLNSQSYTLKSYVGKYINSNNYLDFYLGFTKNIVKGVTSFQPKVDFMSQNNIKNSLNRTEYVALTGFTYIYNYSFFQYEMNYEYNKFFRDGKNKYNVNQLINIVFNFNIYKNINLFIESKYMKHQFMSDIPYSYNNLTAYSFKRHYAYVKTGLIFSF